VHTLLGLADDQKMDTREPVAQGSAARWAL